MALLLVAAVVVAAKTNPELVKDLRRRARKTVSKVRAGNQESLTPALLSGTSEGSENTRSDSAVKGQLEACVMSILGVDGRPLGIVGSADRMELEGDGWEVESGEEVRSPRAIANEKLLLPLAGRGRVVARTQAASSDRVIRFAIFEDQPECLQLYLYVFRRRQGILERHLAVANVPVARALAHRNDLVTASLTVEDTAQPIGVIQVELSYAPGSQSVEAYDYYSSMSPQSIDRRLLGTKNSLPLAVSNPSSKKGWSLRFSGARKNSKPPFLTANDVDGYSANL